MDHNPILDLIHTRRSCRFFRPELPERTVLEAIIEAGRSAPSAKNAQKNHFYVLTNPAHLTAFTDIISRNIPAYEGKDCRFGAPALIVMTNLRESHNALQDVSCAMENMMLAATALGVGSCWINQPLHLDANEELRALLNVSEEERICASLALGLPAKEPLTGPKDHPGNPVTWLE